MPRVKKHDQAPRYITEIGRLMVENGHSQSDLADKIGVNRDRVNNWLQDTAPLNADDLIKIANLYNVPSDRILGIPERESGFSQETVENVQKFKDFVSSFYRQSSIWGTVSEDRFIEIFCHALDNMLSCSSLGPFLVALGNVGLAREAAAKQIEQHADAAAAADVLIKLQFAIYQAGKQGEAIARELHDTDNVEDALKRIALL